MARPRLPAEHFHPLTRRDFLIATIGAGVAFGFARQGEAAMDPAAPDGVPPPGPDPRFEPTLWFAIDADGIVTVNIIRAEVQSNLGDALAQHYPVGFDVCKVVQH